ncbi:NADH-quinone oxidoreductase subunit C [Paenibacillus sp. GSMTC-2017]|uniref:NADH-quinone oxidoreductase subunit C n=1 Tax=Paenibacillus sp. GSMTC-2017 TaxID=2794350 RepID=UPI0018D6674A|nr:NADH-quinone oxidoreductase subunit C [Paenibacillus sp. GSMTC-2017]MBH5320572.1 NADH-quinone oxidoreductase subunit C [Paenibacillus sp. GSMTC-2017]
MSDEDKKQDANIEGESQTSEGAPTSEPQAATPAPASEPQVVTSESAQAPAVDPEREAKLKAAAEAKAARLAAKAKAEAEAAEAEPEQPKLPSVRLPELELIIRVLSNEVASDAVLESYINELNADMPTIVLSGAHWTKAAVVLRDHKELDFNYLRNVSGVDYETHLEVVYHLLSLKSRRDVVIKLRTDREAASVPSAALTWSTANWNEREIYDLLGIDFPGHPDLRRIMMPDDWVGHPLRKDYEPLDSEV